MRWEAARRPREEHADRQMDDTVTTVENFIVPGAVQWQLQLQLLTTLPDRWATFASEEWFVQSSGPAQIAKPRNAR